MAKDDAFRGDLIDMRRLYLAIPGKSEHMRI
jgi:hypothetical protein